MGGHGNSSPLAVWTLALSATIFANRTRVEIWGVHNLRWHIGVQFLETSALWDVPQFIATGRESMFQHTNTSRSQTWTQVEDGCCSGSRSRRRMLAVVGCRGRSQQRMMAYADSDWILLMVVVVMMVQVMVVMSVMVVTDAHVHT